MLRRVQQAKDTRNRTARLASLGRALLAACLAGLFVSCGAERQPTDPSTVLPTEGAISTAPGVVLVDPVPDSIKALSRALESGSSPFTTRGAVVLTEPSAAVVTSAGVQPLATPIPYAPESGVAANAGPACDDCVMTDVPIGFKFNFFGNTYEKLDISSNGFVRFGVVPNRAESGCCSGKPIPQYNGGSLDNLIAFAWSDWYPTQAGKLRYETRGAAPNRRFVLQFNDMPGCCNATSAMRLTGQLILYEATNAAELHITSQTAGRVTTQGAENQTGTLAAFVPGRVNAIYALTSDAVRFTTQIVNNAPTASAGGNAGGPPADHYEGAEGTPIDFAAAGTDPDGDALSYAWDFDNNGTTDATTAAASHSYADDGDFTAKLTVTDAKGASTVATVPVHVTNVAPTVVAGANVTISGGEAVNLDASFSDPGGNDRDWSYTIVWDANSSTASTGTLSTQGHVTSSHTYAAPGVYTVSVTVRDKDGAEGTGTIIVTANNRAPVPVAGGNAGGPPFDHYAGSEGQPIRFDASASHDEDGDALSYAWDFDNDGVADAMTAAASYSYADDGSFVAKLTVFDGRGGMSEVNVPVQVGNVNPTATLVLPTGALAEGTPFSLSLASAADVAADAGSLKYAFDCGGGFGTLGLTPSASCTPDDDGNLTVRGRVQDKDGGFSEYAGSLSVANVAPTGSFTAPTSVTVGNPIVLGFSSATDRGAADMATLQLAFDCGSGAGFGSSAVCATTRVGTRSVYGRVSDKDGGATTYGPTTVTINHAATAAAVDAAAAQYGDPVSLQATLTSAAGPGAGSPTGTMEFFIDGASVGTAQVFGTGAVTLAAPAGARTPGSYAVTATFTPDAGSNFLGSASSAGTLTIQKENVATEYTGDLYVLTAGPSVTSAPVRLAAALTQDPDGHPSNIALARVRFELYRGANLGSTPDQVVDDVLVDGSGYATTTLSLGSDSWTVKVLVPSANGYWVANPIGMSTFTVAVGSTDRHVTGGGWVADAADANGKGNFAFTVNTTDAGATGHAQYVFRGSDGYDYQVRTTSWDGGGLTLYADPSKASFTGTASVRKIDPATGAVVSTASGYTLAFDFVDGDALATSSSDRLTLTILDPSNAVWRRIGTATSPVVLGGGNVAVHGN